MKISYNKNTISAAAMVTLITVMCFFLTVQKTAGEESRLRLGYTGSAFQDSKSNDIKAAVSVLIRKIAWKYFGKSEAKYYDNISEMAAALKSGKVQVLCGPAEEYMGFRNIAPVEPILITSSSSGHEIELLLLVRKDSGINSLSDLKDKRLIMPPQNPKANSLFHLWIETMLMRKCNSSMEKYFSSVKESRTASHGIMPVFFRQADACVVTRHVFNLTAEMNPQLGKELVPIASRDKLSNGIISVDRRLPADTKDKIRQAFLTLPDSPDGKQLLMLFLVNRFIPFRPEYLTSTEALFAEHQRLKNKLTRR